jgi:hypothetical protein
MKKTQPWANLHQHPALHSPGERGLRRARIIPTTSPWLQPLAGPETRGSGGQPCMASLGYHGRRLVFAKGSGSSCTFSPCTWASTRCSRPDVGWAAQSEHPVGRAGCMGAVYAKMLPVSRVNARKRCRLVRTKTHCRTAPSICLAHHSNPSTGRRSRYLACTCAPLSGRGVLSSEGSTPRGS